MDSKLIKICNELESELQDNILPFWMENTVDDISGGFIGRIDSSGETDHNAQKAAVLHSRILWTFSAAYQEYQNPDYLKMAERAFDYIENYFWDRENGGVFWMIDKAGKPFDSKKHIYVQAFIIYGYTEYFKATGNKTALNQAVTLFKYVDKFSYKSKNKGYYEAFDRQWNPLDDVRLGESDILEMYSMNTHLHIMEAYSNLYDVWQSDLLKNRLHELIELHTDVIFDQKSNHFNAFFDENWNSKSDLYSYGHDIEAAWLLVDTSQKLDNQQLYDKVIEVAIKVAYETISEGLDIENGGIYNTGSSGTVVNSDKHWWVQAEAMVGFLDLYLLKEDPLFIQAIEKVWAFTKRHVIDSENGEWFFRVKKNGNAYKTEDKVGPWKCPYHTSRACLKFIKSRAHLYAEHDEIVFNK